MEKQLCSLSLGIHHELIALVEILVTGNYNIAFLIILPATALVKTKI